MFFIDTEGHRVSAESNYQGSGQREVNFLHCVELVQLKISDSFFLQGGRSRSVAVLKVQPRNFSSAYRRLQQPRHRACDRRRLERSCFFVFFLNSFFCSPNFFSFIRYSTLNMESCARSCSVTLTRNFFSPPSHT